MKSKLLAHPFKIIGICIFALAFIVPLVAGAMHPQSWELTEQRREIANAIMLAGLLLFIMSREKVEDEFVDFCRLRAFRIALIAGIIYFLQDALNIFSGKLYHSSFGLLLMEIFIYIIIFYFSKTGILNAE